MPEIVNVEGELAVHLKDGTVITATEFVHLNRVCITKDDTRIVILLSKESSNNSIEVKTIAPLKRG